MIPTVAITVRISSILKAFIMCSFVPIRTAHARIEMTRNISVRTCTSGDLSESVMSLCADDMLGLDL